jgi:23S rRNA (uracil1939-C5)-methyltransferase
MKVGETITLDCVELDDEGAAVGGDRGQPGARVHVAGALPGERVDAVVTHLSHHRPEAWARLTAIVAASPARRSPACRAYGDCGGCVLQHLAYEDQVAWKTARVRAVVMAADRGELSVAVDDCVPSPRPLGYRNRSKLAYARGDDGAPVLGAYAPRSHRVVDLVGGCRIAEPPLDAVAADLRAILVGHAVEPYDERTYAGDLRYAVLRANSLGQVLATLVTARADWPAGRTIAHDLRARHPEVVGVIQNVNPSRGNVIYGDDETTLAGQATFEDTIGGVRLRLSSRSFFQANRDVAARAYRAIADAVALTGAERVVDAYAGVGGIALTLAPGAREVIGIEEHAAAVHDAVAGAALNGIANATFVAGDAGERLAQIDGADVVVLNPPRKGCDPAVLGQVTRLGPRAIAYLSCNPETLARDVVQLQRAGFRARAVTPFDMLPHTPQIEALAIFEPRDRPR